MSSSSINGLELKTPGAAGYQEKIGSGSAIRAVLFADGEAKYCLCKNGAMYNASVLIPLPKPPELRPYRSDEVELGWCFRHRLTGYRYTVECVASDGVAMTNSIVPFGTLFSEYKRCDAKGNILGPAGIEE